MEKELLEQYADACELVRETEERIKKLRERRTTLHDKVTGSMQEFPYAPTSFRIEGTPEAELDIIAQEERLLYLQKADAIELKIRVEEWLLTAPHRLRRIVYFKYFDGLSWEDIADKMKATSGESIRKEFERMIK